MTNCTTHHHACACREAEFVELEAEVLRLRGALETICVHSNTDWDRVTANPLAKIEMIHMTAVNARFGRKGDD